LGATVAVTKDEARQLKDSRKQLLKKHPISMTCGSRLALAPPPVAVNSARHGGVATVRDTAVPCRAVPCRAAQHRGPACHPYLPYKSVESTGTGSGSVAWWAPNTGPVALSSDSSRFFFFVSFFFFSSCAQLVSFFLSRRLLCSLSGALVLTNASSLLPRRRSLYILYLGWMRSGEGGEGGS
jgi:hypothetical protein